MKRTLTCILCLGLILMLCIPMVACDQFLSNGLLGRLFSQTLLDLESNANSATENDLPHIESVLDTLSPDVLTSEWPETEPPIEIEIDTTTEVEYTTEVRTTEVQTTEPATQPITEEETTELIPEPIKVIAAMSLDNLVTIHPIAGKYIISSGYDFLMWNGVADIDTNDIALSVFGWAAYFTETEGTVGYAFNDGEHVYNENFTYTAEAGVQHHIASNCPGALSACRFQFDIPLEGLGAGAHKLVIYAMDTAGNEEVIKEITLNIEQVDPVQEIIPVEFDGTNGTVTIAAGGFYKFLIVNQGGKTMNIANSANCTVTADTYTLPADTIDANGARVQEIPGEGWNNFELTIVNETDAAVEIVLTIQ